LQTYATVNATADFQVGSLGASNGLIFDGTWDVPANGQESSAGLLAPILTTPADFQLDPADIGGISSVHWSLDAEAISSTMVPPDQGIFAQLYIYQEQADGSVQPFSDGDSFVVVGQSVSLDVTATESDFGLPGDRPNFSATGRPLSFGLVLGGNYPKTPKSVALYIDGRITGNNWTAAVTKGGIFKDRFEAQVLLPVLTAPAGNKDCFCP